MIRCKSVGIAVLLPLVFAASAAWADQLPDVAAIRAFQHSRLSLSDAIAAVEKESGGQALDVGFEDAKPHGPSYNATVFAHGEMRNLMVNAATGAVTPGPEKTTPEAKLDQEDRAELNALRSAKLNLTRAVAEAERRIGGKAIDAGLEQHAGQVAYELQLVSKARLHGAVVDPLTGAVTGR